MENDVYNMYFEQDVATIWYLRGNTLTTKIVFYGLVGFGSNNKENYL